MQPRCQWVKKSDNVFIQFLAVIIGILEDGFKIFNPPPITSPLPKVRVFDLVGKDKEAVLKSKHKVNPEKTEEYLKWVLAFINNVELTPGFIEAVKESEQDGVYTWVIRYENVNDLNNAMAAPFWQKRLEELKPLLDAQKVSQILAHTPPVNAFANMMAQGDSMPVLPPKKWKVWWITACALFFADLFINATIGTYFTRWGVQTLHPQLSLLVNIGTIVLILNYLAIPFLQLVVYDWMRRKSGEDDTNFPWKQLNDGFPVPIQLLGFIIYFASTGAVWATN
jgi:antibiotic biosynthesis monooxygenase (ABM) superfamily enzyme